MLYGASVRSIAVSVHHWAVLVDADTYIDIAYAFDYPVICIWLIIFSDRSACYHRHGFDIICYNNHYSLCLANFVQLINVGTFYPYLFGMSINNN
jgi:hypothetical protein